MQAHRRVNTVSAFLVFVAERATLPGSGEEAPPRVLSESQSEEMEQKHRWSV